MPWKFSGSAAETSSDRSPSWLGRPAPHLAQQAHRVGKRVLLAVEARHEATAADLAAGFEQCGRRARRRATAPACARAASVRRKTTPVRRSSWRATNSRGAVASTRLDALGAEQAPAAAPRARAPRRRDDGSSSQRSPPNESHVSRPCADQRAEALLDAWPAAAGIARTISWHEDGAARAQDRRASPRRVGAAARADRSSAAQRGPGLEVGARDERDRRAAQPAMRAAPHSRPHASSPAQRELVEPLAR